MGITIMVRKIHEHNDFVVCQQHTPAIIAKTRAQITLSALFSAETNSITDFRPVNDVNTFCDVTITAQIPFLPLASGYRKFLLADATTGPNANSHSTEADRALVEALADPTAFNWALECVLSRAFQLPPESAKQLYFENEDKDVPARAPEVEAPAEEEARMALLPSIDSINHYSRMPTHMYWEDDGAVSVAGGAST